MAGNSKTISASELEEAGRVLYGRNWVAGLVQCTGLSSTHIYRIKDGLYPVPEGISDLVRQEVARKTKELSELFNRIA